MAIELLKLRFFTGQDRYRDYRRKKNWSKRPPFKQFRCDAGKTLFMPPPPPFELVQCCHDERRLATLVFELDFAKSF